MRGQTDPYLHVHLVSIQKLVVCVVRSCAFPGRPGRAMNKDEDPSCVVIEGTFCNFVLVFINMNQST